MNRIVIIGNGFDRAHNLPTDYRQFINHLKDEFAKSIKVNLQTKLRGYTYESKYFTLGTKYLIDIDISEIVCNNIELLKKFFR